MDRLNNLSLSLPSPYYRAQLLPSNSSQEHGEIHSLLRYEPAQDVFYSIEDEEIARTEMSLETYFTDIQKISNRTIIEKQRIKLLECFKASKFRKSPYEILQKENLNEELNISELKIINLKLKWRQKTKIKQWPKYKRDCNYTLDNLHAINRKKNAPYEVYFIIPLSVGGPTEWWNIFPLTPYQIQNIKAQSNIFYSLFSNHYEEDENDKLESNLESSAFLESALSSVISSKRKYLIKTANDENQYLAINKFIKKESYQYTFFSTEDYFKSDQLKYTQLFTFIPQEDNSYKIKVSNSSENDGYLMTFAARKNADWQWAFVSTQSYIDANKSGSNSKFNLIFNEDETVCIKSIEENASFLAFDYTKKLSPWQWAFFGTSAYIDASNLRYLIKFTLIAVDG